MTSTGEETLRLAREVVYYAGHGYNEGNRDRYPILLSLPQVASRLPVSVTEVEIGNHLDNVLIETIRGYRSSVFLRFSQREVPLEEIRDHWIKFLGLPPYRRAKELERHRREISDSLGGGSVVAWRREGGPEEEFVSHLADRLLNPPGPLGGGSWVVRQSRLHYFMGTDRSIKRLNCHYDAETLVEGVKTFGVDHKSEVRGVAAEYTFLEGSVADCDGVRHHRLDDKSLSIDLDFDDPLPRGERRQLGYDLSVSVAPEGIQRLRLNAAVVVWGHELTVTFAPDVLPERIWWFAHHIGTGAGEEPSADDDQFDLTAIDSTVQQSFSGLRQGPDYGIAFRWSAAERAGDAVTTIT